MKHKAVSVLYVCSILSGYLIFLFIAMIKEWEKGKDKNVLVIGKFKISEAIILFAEIFFSCGEL